MSGSRRTRKLRGSLTPTARRGLVYLVLPVLAGTIAVTVVAVRRSVLLPGVMVGQTHYRLALEHGGIGLRMVSPRNTGLDAIAWGPAPRMFPQYKVTNFVLELSSDRPHGPYRARYVSVLLPAWTVGLPLAALAVRHAGRRGWRDRGAHACACGYDVSGLIGTRCPECGRSWA